MTDKFDNALFEAVDSAHTLMDCDIGAAECHGILCGISCGTQHLEESAWLGHVTGYHESLSLGDLGSGHALAQLFDATTSGFAADDFSLQILIPSDDNPIERRTEALGSWCRGFLSGFGLTDLADIGQLSDDCQGFLRDLQGFGRIESPESYNGEKDNEDEAALLEICEYARIGAMLLLEETLLLGPADPAAGTIH